MRDQKRNSKRRALEMTFGNWLFWGIITFILVGFLWLRFLEPYAPLWGAAVTGVAILALFLVWGPRPEGDRKWPWQKFE